MLTNLNIKKYENTIAYLCQKLGGEIRGKKKLAKLLYFADFDFYEKNQKSITGDTYFALPMGPFPTTLDKVTTGMVRNKLLSVTQVAGRAGHNPTEVYHSIKKVDLTNFSEEEQKMLDRVVVKYGHLSGKQLQELSHAEAPYIGTKLQDEIAYELAFYRGTDFAE